MRIALHSMPQPDGGLLRIHLAEFVAREFDSSAFGAAGIARPSDIGRSVRKRQAEFFFGRLAARAALRDAGAGDVDVPIGPAREPVWPADMVGSISHVDGLAAAVVSRRTRCRGLGIDIERTALAESQAAVQKLAVDAQELAHLRGLDATLTLEERVTLVFSAKESLYKALSGIVGHYFGFEAARVSVIDERRAVVRLVLSCDLHPGFARGHCCDVGFARLDGETFLTAFEARQLAPNGTAGDQMRLARAIPPR
jgi:enterobactin synthetase component D